tara:strand:- start:287 stop:1057 length:771 start_codon:yes stop_codon:yes gene_type:complete
MATEENVIDEVIDSQEQDTVDLFEDSDESVEGDYESPAEEAEELTSDASGVDWETEAKKFQSMKDKAEAELTSWNQYQPLVDLLESRPDLIKLLQENLNSQVSASQDAVSEEDFNPWDAYFKPDSPSFRFREQQEHGKVNQAIQQHMGALQEQVFVNNLVSELKNVYKLGEQDTQEFLQFYAQPKEQLSLDALVDVFVKTKKKDGSKPSSSLDAVRAGKSAPRTAGAVQGKAPAQKSAEDKVWDAVMASSNAGRLP